MDLNSENVLGFRFDNPVDVQKHVRPSTPGFSCNHRIMQPFYRIFVRSPKKYVSLVAHFYLILLEVNEEKHKHICGIWCRADRLKHCRALLHTITLKAILLVQCFSKQDCHSPGRTFSFFLKKCHHYSVFSVFLTRIFFKHDLPVILHAVVWFSFIYLKPHVFLCVLDLASSDMWVSQSIFISHMDEV